jgi:alpha-L-fucosidase
MSGEWFDEARLGMFVHWDHASQQGLEVSWPMAGGIFALPAARTVSIDQYQSSASTFDPQEWDPGTVAALARAAGMGYAVITAKHHAGFAMFHTRLSDFSIANAPYGRDIVGEFVEALRAAGLRVGIYFSLSDWHHPDYPRLTEADKPYAFGQTPPPPGPEAWERYVAYMFGQIREVLTNYGPIDLLWFDGAWERPADRWRAPELEAMIRSLQPGILINDRLPGAGDYTTPEQFVPPSPPAGRWETCMTMNESWGYVPEDADYKTPRQLVHTICEVAGRGGNLLLNVSPTGSGTLPAEQVERLEAIATWMESHGEAVKGTTAGLEPWQFYGPTTRRGERVYLHLLMRPYDSVTVRGVPVRRVRHVTVVGDGRSLPFRTRTGILERLLPDPPGELTIEFEPAAIDPLATVLAVDFA